MAKDDKAKSNKSAIKAQKRELKKAKRAQRKQTFSQMWQAFNMQRKDDKALIPLMLLALIGITVAVFLLGTLWGGQWFMLPVGIVLGAVVAMWIFTRRLQSSMYKRVEDHPGAAGWTLDNRRNTFGIVWFTKQGVGMTRQQDLLHRVVGNPGVVFVGEGSPKRLEKIVEKERRRIDRIAGGVPVHVIYTGTGENQVPLGKLQRKLLKLPRNYSKNDVYEINARIEAMDATSGPGAGMPKGPLPNQAQNPSGMNRRMRRMNAKKGK